MFDFVEVVKSRNSDVTKNGFSLWKRPRFVYNFFSQSKYPDQALRITKSEFESNF